MFQAKKQKARVGMYLEDTILDIKSLIETGAIYVPEEFNCDSIEKLLASNPDALSILKQIEKEYLNKNSSMTNVLWPVDIVKLLPPITRPSKIICVGLNYHSHCFEQGAKIPEYPILFAKYSSAITGDSLPIIKPAVVKKLDCEAELAVIIGQQGKRILKADASKYIAGYANFNDITARDIQLSARQWVRSKSFDTFAPLGPFLVTPEEVGDLGSLYIRCSVNDELWQDSYISDMIFTIPELIEFISENITLMPGDIIATGTPAGVGLFQKPPRFLKHGDVIKTEIQGLGVLQNHVIEEETI